MSIKNYKPRKPTTTPTAQETFRLPLDLSNWLQQFAKVHNVKRSEIIRLALAELRKRAKND